MTFPRCHCLATTPNGSKQCAKLRLLASARTILPFSLFHGRQQFSAPASDFGMDGVADGFHCRIGQTFAPCRQREAEVDVDFARQQTDELRVPAGNERRQEAYTTGGAGRFDMRKYVGGHELCSSAGPVLRQGLSKAASDRTNTAGSNMAGYRQIAPLSCCRTIYPTHPGELVAPGKQVKAAANWSSRLPRAPVRHGQWRVAVVASQLEHVSITVV